MSEKEDRRVQRTRKLLQKAVMELMMEKGYDAVTVQDIAEHANVGRTTFYAHFNSKADLFVSCHEDIVQSLSVGLFTGEGLLNPEPPSALVYFLEEMQQRRGIYLLIARGGGAGEIMRGFNAASAVKVEAALRQHFDEGSSAVSFAVLANYLAGAQISLITWWIESRFSCTAQELAGMLHRLQNAALRDALGL